MIFALWCALVLGHMVAGALLIPKEFLQSYSSRPKDGQYWFLHACWYGVGFSWWIERLTPSRITLAIGLCLFVLGSALLIWARRSNPYFSPDIDIPLLVVDKGAYALFEHPGYLGMDLMAFGSWFLLGCSWYSYSFLFAYVAVVAHRVQRENDLLRGLK